MITNVHIYAYGDPDQLRRCLDSIPAGLDVRVFDGRYCHFDGERDTTPAFEPICRNYSNVELHVPPEEILPFGFEDLPSEWRSDVYEKTRWVWSHLPEDEWTMKLDTDETIESLPRDLELDPRKKYCPLLYANEPNRRKIHTCRVWKPEHWTHWINDCLVPRELFERDTSLEKLATIWNNKMYQMLRYANRAELPEVELRNYGDERPAEYQRRRVAHLETIGREERAEEVRKFAE